MVQQKSIFSSTGSNFLTSDLPPRAQTRGDPSESIVISHRDQMRKIVSQAEKTIEKSPRFMTIYIQKPVMTKRGKSTQPVRKV